MFSSKKAQEMMYAYTGLFFAVVISLLVFLIYVNGFASVVSPIQDVAEQSTDFDPLTKLFYSNINILIIIAILIGAYVAVRRYL